MNNQYTEKNISLGLLFDYVFKNLSPQQDNAMESFLDNNEEHADLVDGILNYCMDENIKSKEDLEKKLKVNKESFFAKFPNLSKYDLDKTDNHKKLDNNEKRKYGWFILLIFLIGAFSIWKMNDTKKEKKEHNIEKINDPSKINNSFEEKNIPPRNKEEDIKELQNIPKKPDPKKEKSKKNKSKKELKKKELKKKESKSKIIFAEIKYDLEKTNPINSSALDYWKGEFTVRGGNPVIETAENFLTQGDSSQKSLYCIGLNELTKTPPNFSKAIELLKKVRQNEHPDATWFLFRAYILADDYEKAKVEFQKMHSSTEVSNYYEKELLKSLPESTKTFFQSNDN